MDIKTQLPPEPAIHHLPVEVLQEIFHKVAQRSKTIRHIRLTCRYWRDLVASDRTLPRRIAMQSEMREIERAYPYSEARDYYAHDIDGLARALVYIQDANFELYMQLHKPLFPRDKESENGTEEVVPWDRFEMQCTSLTIPWAHSSLKQSLLQFIGYLPTLENLNSLSVMRTNVLPSIMQHIPPSPTRLRSLTLLPGAGPVGDMELYPLIRPVLKGLRTFKVSGSNRGLSVTFLKALLSSFESLEELIFDRGPNLTKEEVDLIRQSVNRNLQPRMLKIYTTMLPMFPISLLRGLIDLSLYHPFNQQDVKSDDPKVYLPQLTTLSLERSNTGLSLFETPNLKEIYLRFTRWNDRTDRAQLLYPVLVHITDRDPSMASFLLDPPLPNISELHIHGDFLRECSIPEVLSRSLSGQASLFPNLQRLIVRMRFSKREEFEHFERELLGVTSSCTQLISVRCSWVTREGRESKIQHTKAGTLPYEMQSKPE
ncbi:hypothetical protein FRC19_011181 [Serendipita sp. 401]|nr:hypothetical protein FRC19_011181 [Serendipita sp. 401]